MKYLLKPEFDGRKSFYGKAVVESTWDFETLISYGDTVARIDNGFRQVELFEGWDGSQTTVRHVKEFLRQQGFKAETKAQIREDYE